MSDFEIFAVTPPSYLVREYFASGSNGVESFPAPLVHIALAAARAGHVGIIDLQFLNLDNPSCREACREAIFSTLLEGDRLPGRLGVKSGVSQLSALEQVLDPGKKSDNKQANAPVRHSDFIVIIVPDADNRQLVSDDKVLAKQIAKLKKASVTVYLEIISVREAVAAASLGVDGVIAKGHESQGAVSDETAFVLLQQCLRQVKVPIFAEGGIGLHTTAACYAAGASGVVVTNQLSLATESPLPFELKVKIEQMDGTEPSILNLEGSQTYRLYGRPNHPLMESLTGKALSVVRQQLLASRTEVNPINWIFPLAQDVAFASSLAKRYGSVAGILDALKLACIEHVSSAKLEKPLAPNSELAKSHGSRYPIVQGAMTRVSDCADFAFKVAEGGGLPFLALALMRKSEADCLMSETKSKLGNLPWGVGLLGFVPAQLRQEQMEVIQAYKPPYALIAGGRPDQAKFLEDQGIKTYLHVPSPLLLGSFIEMGSRRFIFEGRECGGHVGPRSSFVLWESMIELLLDAIGPKDDGSAYHVLFAGGVHDDLSASMVAAMAAPLAVRGVKVGVLMGTAYLFTEEAVSTGAIVKKFQEAAIDCHETVLLETGPGHAIRCVESPYKSTFDEKRQTLLKNGKGRDEVREELELMNLGRLRIASKGLTRASSLTKDQIVTEMAQPSTNTVSRADLLNVSEDQQWLEGMYMIGQVASLRESVCTIADLHEKVSAGGTSRLDAIDMADQTLSTPLVASGEPIQEREGIAIVGMSCLLPKAKDVETYWQNILNKLDTIEEIPAEQWDWRNYYDADPQARDKIYSKWGGFLESREFDPTKYGIPPSSLDSIDPMQILLLEVTDAALKDAGYGNRPFPKERTSVVLANAGHGPITALYSLRSMLGWKLADLPADEKAKLQDRLPEWTEDSFPGYLGNVTAGRVANRFDLGGLNFSIDAACASSLAALHIAVAELRNGNSDMVLLSATDTHNQPGDYLSFSKTHAFSASGRCRSFDSNADGIVISEGMAMLVLKRLSDAKRDGDRIYAVIRGIGGSSDGRDLSLTAPRPAGQVKALVRAYQDANIDPSTVSLIEAHGTGTIAGDRAEVEALKQVFENHGARDNSCAIGSVKTMIGHTKAAAGLASLIKVAKALYHKVLPPTLGVQVPNPACHFESGPFYINSETRPWILNRTLDSEVRRAGVSAFGFGGTNFHTVLEEYIPEPRAASRERVEQAMPAELFLFHGRNQGELLKILSTFSDSLKRYSQEERESASLLSSLAYLNYLKSVDLPGTRSTAKREGLQDSGSSTDQCLAIVADSLVDLETKLSHTKGDLLASKEQIKDPRGIYFKRRTAPYTGKVAFVFPGQGSQQINMLRDLGLQFHEVIEIFEEANSSLTSVLPKALSEYIYPPPSFSTEDEAAKQQELTATQIAQPAMGAADLAVLTLLENFGVKPNMVAGHSYGEFVALFAAKCLSFSDLMRISAERGRLLGRMSPGVRGTMAAVRLSEAELKPLIGQMSDVTIANLNSPNQSVIAGDEERISEAIVLLKEKGVSCKRIPVSQAFHSPLMGHAVSKLRQALATVQFKKSEIPVYGNIDGLVYPDDVGQFVERLTKHIVSPVHFVSEIKNMHADGADVFIEVGPGSVLTGLVESTLAGENILALAVDRSGRNGVTTLLHVIGQLASHGLPVDLRRLYALRASKLAAQTSSNLTTSKTKRLTYAVNSVSIKRIGSSLTGQSSGANMGVALATKTGTHASDLHRVAAPVAGTASNNRSEKEPQIQHRSNAAIAGMPGDRVEKEMNKNDSSKHGGKIIAAVDQSPATSRAGAPSRQTPAIKASTQPRRPSTGSSVDQVMVQFQQTMLEMTNNFLETQQNVMLAYLQGQQSTSPNLPKLDEASLQSVVSQTSERSFALGVAAGGANGGADYPLNRGSGQVIVQQPSELVKEYVGEKPSLVSASKPPSEPSNESQASKEEAVDSEILVNSLLDIVSQRTGYPTEMLDPSLDLEADLGIDSIKRVEILNSFRRILPEAKQKQLETGIEQLAGTKTLQGIIDWLRSEPASTDTVPTVESNTAIGQGVDADNGNGKHANASPKLDLIDFSAGRSVPELANASKPTNGNGADHYQTVDGGNGSSKLVRSNDVLDSVTTIGTNINRAIVKPIPLPMPAAGSTVNDDKRKQVLKNRFVLITQDGYGLSDAVAKTFQENGFQPVILVHKREIGKCESVSAKKHAYAFDLTNPVALEDALGQLTKTFGDALSIVHLQSISKDRASLPQDLNSVSDSVISLFLLIKYLSGRLARMSSEYGCGILAATAMGGTFGSGGNGSDLDGPISTLQAGIVGLMKSARKELPAVNCKVVDFEKALWVDGNKAHSSIASKLLAELVAHEPIVEIGYQGSNRFGLDVEVQQVNSSKPVSSNLNSKSVILITGGARGITAEIAEELAKRYQPKIIIVGRSERPENVEDACYEGLFTPREIKGALIENLKATGSTVSIPTVEARYQSLMRDREIRTNLARLTDAGATIEYYALDVRDATLFASLIKDIYVKHGQINAVVHGAGVIEDAYMKDKQPDSFRRVFETKVLGALTLVDNLRLDSLDYLVLFSSVVGRTGNAGQGDYVAANEVMNKLAVALSSKVRGRVASLMWGPWQGGMAQPELESIFASYGWAMINPTAGRRVFMDELSYGNKRDAEVLLVAELDKLTSLTPTGARLHQSSLRRLPSGENDYEFAFEINTATDVFLADHTFDGVPVMPMAFALEFMSEAVASVYPDRTILAVENLDIPAGIVFETNSKMVFVSVHEENDDRNNLRATVIASLSSGINQRRVNFKARFIVGIATEIAELPKKIPSAFSLASSLPDLGGDVPVPPLSQIYGTWLFHGPIFQGIKDVYAVGPYGVVGSIVGSNTKSCFKSAGQDGWQLDPILIDSAMQCAGIWARCHLDITVLPTGFRRLTKFARPGSGPFAVRIFIAPESSAVELTCDVAIYNEDGQLQMLIEGLGGVGSKALNRLSSSGIGVSAGR